jgi:hypothetical protein
MIVNFQLTILQTPRLLGEGSLVTINSQYIHSEVVKPSIALLQEKHFHGASDEFLKAHEHYRKGRYKRPLA